MRFVIRKQNEIEIISSGLLNAIAALPPESDRVYVFDNYSGSDVPGNYYTAMAQAYKRFNESAYVILYGRHNVPLINRYEGGVWKGWTTLDRIWTKLCEVDSTANTALDTYLTVSYPKFCNDIMFTVQRKSNGRTIASTVVSLGQFQGGGIYAMGSYQIAAGLIDALGSNTLVNAVAIYISDTQIQIAANPLSEELRFRVYAR